MPRTTIRSEDITDLQVKTADIEAAAVTSAKLAAGAVDTTQITANKDDIAYTPIGIPLIAGPGAISSVMIFSSDTDHWEYKLVLLDVIGLVMGFTYIIFQTADYLTQCFRTIGLRITQRIMGLILIHCRAVCN